MAHAARPADRSDAPGGRMMTAYWLKSLLRTAAGRTAATAAGIALAVALAAVLGIFVISAAATMTRQAVANVPVDWQIEIAPGADPAAVENALATAATPQAIRPVAYAKVDGFSAVTGDTQQVTGPGQVIGMGPDYLATFPGQLTLLSGTLGGPVLYGQTAANLHAGVGDTIRIARAGIPVATVTVSGVAAIPNIDSLFQAVGVPSGLAPQSPPDNILILPAATWHSLFDAQRAAQPDSVRTQLHVRLDRARLPSDPVGAFTVVKRMANSLATRLAGSAAIADNLSARLDGVRGDALYAKVLFLFLGAPGVVLAALVAVEIAGAGRARRRREQALLRIRGADMVEILAQPAVEAGVIGVAGVLAGLVLARGVLMLMGIGAASTGVGAWLAFAALAGLALAAVAILLPAARDARSLTVASARLDTDASARPLWQRLWLDLALLVLAGLIFWRVRATSYEIVLASEGVAQTSVHYEAFLAPLALWLGLGMLWVRLSRFGLAAGARLCKHVVAATAGDLAEIVAASLSQQASRLARGVGLLALAAGFAVSTAIFNITYDHQAHVDAELTNGADVNVTGSTDHPASAQLARIRAAPGVTAAEPMMHRYAYVGADLQDLYGIDPRSISKATTMANAYFSNRDAETTLAKLAATRDGVLVSEETVQDFQLQPGDTVNLRLQSAADHQYHVVPFTFVGIAGEFPTAPKDSFLVANSDYIAAATATDAHEVVLVRASDASAAATLKSLLAADAALKVTALGEVRSLIASSLTSVSLAGLTRLEVVFGLALVGAAAALGLGLGFLERSRTYAILAALGASPAQLGAFLRSEAMLVSVAGLVFGTVSGFGVAWTLVMMLAGAFDPPPETIVVPYGYIALALLGAAAVAAMVVAGFERAHARTDPAALKPE
jgi:putative ABC transport system permease protein